MKSELRFLIRTAIMVALAVTVQSMNLPQPVTGSAINAVLFVSAIYVGPWSGAVVGLITPWVALLTGILKLAPAVPVVMAGNIVLALVSGFGSRFNRYLAMGLASICKWAAMTAGVKYLVSSGTKIPAAAYASLTTTQLFTAFGGAIAAAIILEALWRLRDGRSTS